MHRLFTSIRYSAACLALGLLFAATAANATLMLTIDRVSDTKGILSGTGTIAGTTPAVPNVNDHVIALLAPFGVAPTALAQVADGNTSTLSTTTSPFFFNFAFQADPGTGFFGALSGLYFGGMTFGAGDTIEGAMEINLLGGATWAAIGTTGIVEWGIFGTPVNIGTWEIVGQTTVPEAASLGLLGLALAGLGLIARRRVR